MTAPSNIESLAAARARKLFPHSIRSIEGDANANGLRRRFDAPPCLRLIKRHPDARCAELVGDD